MRSWTLAATFAVSLALSTPAYAQDPGAGARLHKEDGRIGRRGPGRDPVLLNGPPRPEEFTRITGLEESKQPRYAELYQSFMSKTQPQRASLKTSLDSMRQRFQSGDRSSARGHRSALRELRERLAQEQQQFDASVKQLLSSSQWSKYQEWQEAERTRARKERREHRHRA